MAERTLGAKATVTVPAIRPGAVRHEEAQAADRQALPDDQIVALAELSDRRRRLMGAPQDIEWAWAGGKLHLLQSRPITALYPLPPVGRSRPATCGSTSTSMRCRAWPSR